MKTPLIVTFLAISIAVFYSCSSTKSSSSSGNGGSSSSVVKVFGPGSSPDTIHVNLPPGPRRYYLVVKSLKSGPGSSPDTIALQSGQPIVIYKSKDDSKKP